MSTYSIAIIRNWYAGETRNSIDWVRDDRADRIEYSTVAEALGRVEELDADVYVTDSNEAGRPEYIVVDAGTAEYIETGRGYDGSNYDWSGCQCDDAAGHPDGYCCGECDSCMAAMQDQDEEYIRDHSAHAYDAAMLASLGYGDVTAEGEHVWLTDGDVSELAQAVGGSVDEIETARV